MTTTESGRVANKLICTATGKATRKKKKKNLSGDNSMYQIWYGHINCVYLKYLSIQIERSSNSSPANFQLVIDFFYKKKKTNSWRLKNYVIKKSSYTGRSGSFRRKLRWSIGNRSRISLWYRESFNSKPGFTRTIQIDFSNNFFSDEGGWISSIV